MLVLPFKFIDGRFYFPGNGVNWHYLVETSRMKHLNPTGMARIHDVVIRSESASRPGAIVARIKGAAFAFQSLRRDRAALENYTSFWKGVRLFYRTPGFRERLRVGAVRPPPSIAADLYDGSTAEDAEFVDVVQSAYTFSGGDDWAGCGDA